MSYLAKLSAIVARWVPCGNPDLIQLLDFDACEAILDSELEAMTVHIDTIAEENTVDAYAVDVLPLTAEIFDTVVEPAVTLMPFMPAGESKTLPVSVWGSPLPNAIAISADDICILDGTSDIQQHGATTEQYTKSPDLHQTSRKGNKAKQRRAAASAAREETLLSRGDNNDQRADNRNSKKTLKAFARQAGVKRLDFNDLTIRSVEIR